MDPQTLERLHALVPSSTEFDDAVTEHLFDIADLIDAINGRIDALAEASGLPSLHFYLLEYLALEGGTAPLKEVLSALKVPKQSATYVVDKLEGRGLIERRRDTADRRRFELALTAKGRAMAESDLSPFYAAVLGAMQAVDASDREAVVRGLTVFLQSLQPSD